MWETSFLDHFLNFLLKYTFIFISINKHVTNKREFSFPNQKYFWFEKKNVRMFFVLCWKGSRKQRTFCHYTNLAVTVKEENYALSKWKSCQNIALCQGDHFSFWYLKLICWRVIIKYAKIHIRIKREKKMYESIQKFSVW